MIFPCLLFSDHGHFEGDASLSREDYYFNGQNSKLSQDRYKVFKSFNDKYGSGNATTKSLIEYRYQRFQDSQKDNPHFQFAFPRYLFSYGEAALVLNLFSNSKDGLTGKSVKPSDLDSFFLEEKFPENFYPIDHPYSFLEVAIDTIQILAPRFVLPGQNVGSGYVPIGPFISLDDLTPNNVVSRELFLTHSRELSLTHFFPSITDSGLSFCSLFFLSLSFSLCQGCALYESVIAGGQTPSALQGLADDLLSAVSNLASLIYKPAKDAFNCAPANVTDPSLSAQN